MAQLDSGNREVRAGCTESLSPLNDGGALPFASPISFVSPLSNPLYRPWNAMIRFLTSNQVYLKLASLHGFMV